MNKNLVVMGVLLTISTSSYAESVKGILKRDTTESQAKEAAAKVQSETGRTTQIVRDSSGKVESIVISLPDNDNEGIKRASEAISNNKGVSTVLIETNTPKYISNGLTASVNGAEYQGGTFDPSNDTISLQVVGGTGPYSTKFKESNSNPDFADEYSPIFSHTGIWEWDGQINLVFTPGNNMTGAPVTEVVVVTDSTGKSVEIPVTISNTFFVQYPNTEVRSGSTGIAKVWGGTGPYTYEITNSTSPGATLESRYFESGGNYGDLSLNATDAGVVSIKISDAAGNVYTMDVNVTQATLICGRWGCYYQ